MQAVGCVSQVGLADSGSTLGVSLPSCSEQRAGDRTPQLGAGSPLRKGERSPLSDKDLEAVVDDAVENALSPWGTALERDRALEPVGPSLHSTFRRRDLAAQFSRWQMLSACC